MKRVSRFMRPLRISLGALLVMLSLFSAAWADPKETASSVAQAVSERADHQPTDVSSQATSQCGDESPSSLVDTFLALAASTAGTSDASTALACAAGTVATCCSCGCGCRRQTISPQNFCRFFFCI